MKERSRYKLKIVVLLSVLMTVLLLCATLFISAMLRSSVRRQAEENGRNTLAQLRSSTEIILDVMDNSLVQMALDTDLQSFCDRYEFLDIFDCEELYQRLYQFRAVNPFIEKLYIHYYANGMVLDLNGKDPRLTALENLEDWERIASATARTLRERYNYPVTLFTEGGQLYAAKPASPIAATPSAVIVVTLRQSYFQEIMQAISLDEACSLYVTDRDGHYLFGKDDAPLHPAGKAEGLSLVNASPDTGWTYYYQIPQEEIDRQVSNVTRLLWVVIAVMAALSFAGVCLLAQELYKPVQRLMDDKEEVERLLEENKPFLREDILRRLLEPSDTPEEQWWILLERYNVNCRPGGCYAAMVLAFEQYERLIQKIGEPAFDELMLCKTQQLRDLSERLPDGAIELVWDRRKAKFALIISLDTLNQARAEKRSEELAGQIFSAMQKDIPLIVTMGVGHAYRQISHLCASYEEAVAAYQYRAVAGDGRILYAKDLPDVQEQGFLFPNKLAQDVFRAVKQEDRQVLETQLDRFFAYVRENLRPNIHPSYVAVQFFNGTLQFLQELSVDARTIFADLSDESAHILQLETVGALEEYFCRLMVQLQDYLRCQRAQPEQRVSGLIRVYLDEHYTDESVSLTLLADELHFSVSYLAREFKNDTGKSIKEYITCKRMEAAKILLADKDARVGEVARQVGYTNARSFINMFKKYTGVTPGAYKEQI